jgi:hypothetical protein
VFHLMPLCMKHNLRHLGQDIRVFERELQCDFDGLDEDVQLTAHQAT